MFYVDVRSPKEYINGHIPGGYNLPLLSNLEREEVGIAYKKTHPQVGFELALRYISPKLTSLVTEAHQFPSPFILYCARGGLRSQCLHTLFSQAGIETQLYQGGYKAYRKWVLNFLQMPFPFCVLSGLTGCGKTEKLHALQAQGEHILDLENLANHKGSVFGNLGEQPSNEHFENKIASILCAFPKDQPIWVEDESRLIGNCKIPDPIYDQMRRAPKKKIFCSQHERHARLIREYGSLHPSELIIATKKLQKRLGLEKTEKIIEAIIQGNRATAIDILLTYYDRTYSNTH